jgi:hypothetical protein
MAFLIDEAYLPAILTVGPMTDEEFANFCAEHPDLSFEMTADGELIVMPLTFTLTGARNSEIAVQLGTWRRWAHGSRMVRSGGDNSDGSPHSDQGSAWAGRRAPEAVRSELRQPAHDF